MDEVDEQLSVGGVTDVMRVGDTVRRPVRPFTASEGKLANRCARSRLGSCLPNAGYCGFDEAKRRLDVTPNHRDSANVGSRIEELHEQVVDCAEPVSTARLFYELLRVPMLLALWRSAA